MPYDRKTVDSAIKALESKGLVKKVYRHRADDTMTSNLYYLTDLLDTGRNFTLGGFRISYQ